MEWNQLVLALSIDIKGAYNSVRPAILLPKLLNKGTFANILNFINFITSSRNLHFSTQDRNPQATYVGLPQGGVLSPLLYNIYTSSILKHIGPNTKTTIYVDDIFLYTTCHTVQEGLAELQHSIQLLSNWLKSIGLIISIPKCKLCLFTKAQTEYNNISLEVNGVLIPCQQEIEYLGITFDSRLNWRKHIGKIVEKAAKAINTLKALARVSRGASSESLLLVFKGLIRAYLEWGSVLFMEAAQYLLKVLDAQQFKALRIILGCMSSTPLYFY